MYHSKLLVTKRDGTEKERERDRGGGKGGGGGMRKKEMVVGYQSVRGLLTS